MCVCVCLRLKYSSKPRLTKFTPAVVMSAGSFWNIGAQKLRPALCVNLYIQVHDVKSSHTRAAKLEHLGEVGAHSPLPFFLQLSSFACHYSSLPRPRQKWLPLKEFFSSLPRVDLSHPQLVAPHSVAVYLQISPKTDVSPGLQHSVKPTCQTQGLRDDI